MSSSDLGRIREIEDPRDRARLAHGLIGELQAEAAEASRIRSDAVTELITQRGATRIEVAELLGVSRERVRQIIAEGPPPERALLAPDSGPLTVCVIAKREAEHGAGPVISGTTVTARDKLLDLASSWDIQAHWETVPVSGMINLNRPNLAVLIGPRSSMLVAQAISADPVIKWQPGSNGDWYFTDTTTGTEYHSEFDHDADPGAPWPRACYAHIGRIRRPDGQGSWLCLAGEHRPGVAGAVDLVCHDTAALFEQARRSLWSAVAQVTAGEDGEPEDVKLVSPVYVHGRR